MSASDSSSNDDSDDGLLSRADALRLKRSAHFNVRDAKTALKAAKDVKKKAVALERSLQASISIAGQTPYSAARVLARQHRELEELTKHMERRSCSCASCNVRSATRLLEVAREGKSEADERYRAATDCETASSVESALADSRQWDVDMGADFMAAISSLSVGVRSWCRPSVKRGGA